jgi:hypothetical protein
MRQIVLKYIYYPTYSRYLRTYKSKAGDLLLLLKTRGILVLRTDRKVPQYNESHTSKSHSEHHIQWGRLKAFPQRSGKGKGFSPLLFNIFLI